MKDLSSGPALQINMAFQSKSTTQLSMSMSLYFLSSNLGKTPTATILNTSFPWTLVVSQTHILIPQDTHVGLMWGWDSSSSSSPFVLSLWSVSWAAHHLGSINIHKWWCYKRNGTLWQYSLSLHKFKSSLLSTLTYARQSIIRLLLHPEKWRWGWGGAKGSREKDRI